jgi:hypothetical protein
VNIAYSFLKNEDYLETLLGELSVSELQAHLRSEVVSLEWVDGAMRLAGTRQKAEPHFQESPSLSPQTLTC